MSRPMRILQFWRRTHIIYSGENVAGGIEVVRLQIKDGYYMHFNQLQSQYMDTLEEVRIIEGKQ